MVIAGTADCRDWMTAHGARFQPSIGGALHLSHTNAFFLGGGKALINAYYRAAARLGVEIEYDAEVRDLDIEDGRFESAVVARNGGSEMVRARTFVAASGGFQANRDWLKDAWGDAADNFLIRGTPYDTGRVLRALMDRGASTTGDPTQCHAVAIDGRAPRFDGGIVTRVDCIPLGIVVNARAERFHDEGEDLWPKRYAVWGHLVARQPEQTAFVIFDTQAPGLFIPPMLPPVEAPSIPRLAAALGLDPAALERTVSAYNRAVQPGAFDHTALDNCSTAGLTPPKSHWARRIDRAPFYAYPLRPGITFTYLGVTVDERARIIWQDGRPAANLFAAGEIMAGNILGQGLSGRAGHGHRNGIRPAGRRGGGTTCPQLDTRGGAGAAAAAPALPGRGGMRPASATPAATAKGSAPCSRRSSGALTSRSATSATWRTCATTAARAWTPASMRRRTRSGSTCPAPWPPSGARPYRGYAWPAALGGLFERSGLALLLGAALAPVLFAAVLGLLSGADVFLAPAQQRGRGLLPGHAAHGDGLACSARSGRLPPSRCWSAWCGAGATWPRCRSVARNRARRGLRCGRS